MEVVAIGEALIGVLSHDCKCQNCLSITVILPIYNTSFIGDSF
ncbi:hypothetical protein PNIG_a2860 [Pseudoalteromonas nigrifaciens]|jgi:hypothetical protein|uniref:Uncharacterized protein n=2 Tax=Pseudoalteromonas TaxID=53246 RepID=A0ABR9ET36_PSEVC|nr:hypothetical protein PNIG_a2860 [Pseudoalteromonas nigrifaciens]MBE0382439.1 hypothetical protein [Pseudoalteromonas carrageenovora IAM 12662]SUC51349.1 Uncharacterised protein [Pseudoalteromonas nigrifaciens]